MKAFGFMSLGVFITVAANTTFSDSVRCGAGWLIAVGCACALALAIKELASWR